jgi:hypothetical protein
LLFLGRRAVKKKSKKEEKKEIVEKEGRER